MKNIALLIGIFLTSFLGCFVLTAAADAACVSHNVGGWAWSSNIGWISLSCENEYDIGAGTDYGVDINEGIFSGYAWSSNIGWVNMAPSGTYPALPSHYTQSDAGGQVSGWARACTVFETGCSGDLKTADKRGGWEGWIEMGGATHELTIFSGGFSGYAWSDLVIGWIDFGTATTTYDLNSSPEHITTTDMDVTKSGCSLVEEIPTLSWVYDDPDNVPPGTDPQTARQVRIGTDSVFEVDSNDDAVLGADEFTCSGSICSAQTSSLSFSPLAESWISWANYGDTFYWKVRVEDSNNNWSSWSDTDSFESSVHTYPKPRFSFDPKDPNVDTVVMFTDSSLCYDSLNQAYNCREDVDNRYLWSFGDSGVCDSNSNSLCRGSATHTYSDVLDYTVSLQITDGLGTCSTETAIRTILSVPDYKEVPPSSAIENFFASIVDFFRNLVHP